MPPVTAEIRFHLDECVDVDVAVAEGLRRRGIDVTTARESGLRGVPDEAQLAFALREGRVLVTQDSDFLRLHQQGVRHAGLCYYPAGAISTGKLIRSLVLVHAVLSPEQMQGCVEFL